MARAVLRQGGEHRLERGDVRDVHGQNLIPPSVDGQELHLCASAVHFGEKDALLPRLVKTAALHTAGPGVRRVPGLHDAAEAVHMAERGIVHAADRGLLGGDRVIGRGGVTHLAVDAEQLNLPLARAAPAAQQRRAPAVGEGRAPDAHAERGQLNGRQPILAEDMYILRKAQTGVGAVRHVIIVVAGGDEHLAAAAVEHVSQQPRRLAVGAVGIKQIAGQEEDLRAVLARKLRQRAQKRALLLPPLGRERPGQRLKGRIQMQIRRVEHPDAHRMRSASALRQSPVSQSMVKIAPSSLQRPAAAS